MIASRDGTRRVTSTDTLSRYNKTEGLSLRELDRFDFLIVGTGDGNLRKIMERDYPRHRAMEIRKGFNRFSAKIE